MLLEIQDYDYNLQSTGLIFINTDQIIEIKPCENGLFQMHTSRVMHYIDDDAFSKIKEIMK